MISKRYRWAFRLRRGQQRGFPLHLWTGVLVLLAITSAGRAADQVGLPAALLQQVRSPTELQPGQYTAADAWDAAGTALSRQRGRIVADPDAASGKAWEVGIGTADNEATLFGPYRQFKPGWYIAFFRVKLLAADADELAVDLDAAVNDGHQILEARALPISDLVQGQYVQVPLTFHYQGGRLECRVHWHGLAALHVDQVGLYRFDGGTLEPLPRRPGQPQPSGRPRNLEANPEPDQVFPVSSAPAPKLWVVDVAPLSRDWELTLASLQGIVNRGQPQVFLRHNPCDDQWLAWMVKRGAIAATATITAEALLERFQPVLHGLVITDPALPASKHVATMLAAVDDALVVSPRLGAQLGWPVHADLRGRWTTSVAAYRWALDQLWPRMNHQVVACYWPGGAGAYDYFVEHKIFLFWCSGPVDGARTYARPQEELQLAEEVLAKMPANTAVMGYPWAGPGVGIGEGPGVTLFAEFAKYLVGSVDATNLSVHSGMGGAAFRQHAAPPAPALDKSKVYVSVIISDGDNLPVLTLYNFPQLWADPLRGTFPIGWTIAPSAARLLPDVLDYYYSTATPQDCFLAAVSGVGYTYPASYGLRYRPDQRARVFDGFLDQTSAAMEHCDLHLSWVMNTPHDLIGRYAERIPHLRGVFADYGRQGGRTGPDVYPAARNAGVFHAVTDWKEDVSRAEQIARTAEQLRRATPPQRPAFLHFFIWNWGYDLGMIHAVLERLGPQYVAVRPDHLAALYAQQVTDEQVLLRVPAESWGIQGQKMTIEGEAQNTAGAPLDLALAAAGLEHGTLAPDHLHLAPGQTAPFWLSGATAADSLTLTATGALGKRSATVALRWIPRDQIVGTVGAGVTWGFQWRMDAAKLAHRGGHAVADAQAADGAAWSAEAGKTEPGHIIYGPYAPTPPGRYLALFGLQRTGEGSGELARVDASAAMPYHENAAQTVAGAALARGQYRYVPVEFVHPGGTLETRVYWPGEISLAVESVTLFRAADDRR